MIEVQNLSFSYPGASSKVFDGFQLKLESGHTYGLLGRNGTGKSTLLYLASARRRAISISTAWNRPSAIR